MTAYLKYRLEKSGITHPEKVCICQTDQAWMFKETGIATIVGNEIVLNLHRKMGFKEECLLRQQIFKNGRYLDLVGVGLLAEEFRALQPQLRQSLGLTHGTGFEAKLK
jgi:hypothetical protein